MYMLVPVSFGCHRCRCRCPSIWEYWCRCRWISENRCRYRCRCRFWCRLRSITRSHVHITPNTMKYYRAAGGGVEVPFAICYVIMIPWYFYRIKKYNWLAAGPEKKNILLFLYKIILERRHHLTFWLIWWFFWVFNFTNWNVWRCLTRYIRYFCTAYCH